VLETGRITAIGTHEELLTSSPTYQKLYQLQFIDVPEALEPDSADQYHLFDSQSALATGTQE